MSLIPTFYRHSSPKGRRRIWWRWKKIKGEEEEEEEEGEEKDTKDEEKGVDKVDNNNVSEE